VGEDGVSDAAGDVSIDKHALYELCVQSVDAVVPFLRAVHGGEPVVLGEDFAGTAALSHRWVRDVAGGTAVAVDLDDDALRSREGDDRVEAVHGDVRHCKAAADVLFVGNFSIGYWHARAGLLEYLRHARSRLNPGGVFVCDTYGGETSFEVGDVHRDLVVPVDHPSPVLAPHRGKRVRYTWEQREADPVTGMVTDVCHFRVTGLGGRIELELDDAFVYRWRLWSAPELADAMLESGFSRVEVYSKTADAVDGDGNVYVRPIEDGGEELDRDYVVFIAGRL
jgi:SAM-dependent methyltransferase